MDLNSLLAQLAALGGVAAFITFLVNALKQFGVVKDGDALNWVTGLNLVALVGLFVAHIVGFNVTGLDTILATLAQIGTMLLALLLQVGVSRVAHTLVKGTWVIGKSFS